jgi:membrane-associated phospholipid phosphatase
MLRWTILVLLMFSAAVGVAIQGMSVTGLIMPMGIMGVVGVAAFHFRHEENFTLCLSALVQILVFSMSYILLTYLGAGLAFPLWDKQLTAWDAALGFHMPPVKAWLALHPWVDGFLVCVYSSLLPQTAAIIAILGFRNERKKLETFILRMMIAALVAYMFFIWMPAEGPFGAYGMTPAGWGEANYIEHVRSLRAGTFHHFNFAEAQGLITFPSFHVVWAIFLFMAVRHLRFVNVLFAVLEVAVILATVPAGGHYLVDVPAGFVLAAAVCWITAEKTKGVPAPSASPESS